MENNIFKQFQKNENVINNIDNYKIVILFEENDAKFINEILPAALKKEIVFIGYGNKDYFGIQKTNNIFFNLQKEKYDNYAQIYKNYKNLIKDLIKKYGKNFIENFDFNNYLENIKAFEKFETEFFNQKKVLENKKEAEKLLKKYFIELIKIYELNEEIEFEIALKTDFENEDEEDFFENEATEEDDFFEDEEEDEEEFEIAF